MDQHAIREALEAHDPQGDYDGYVAYCSCGWDGTDAGGDYRDHAANIIATAITGK